MAYVMRYGYESDMKERTSLLMLIAQNLRLYAQKYHVAVSSWNQKCTVPHDLHSLFPLTATFSFFQVVITNQMTYNLDEEKETPALGKNWCSTCSTKICLSREQGSEWKRTATLVKSPLSGRQTGIQFRVTVSNCRQALACVSHYIIHSGSRDMLIEYSEATSC